MLKSYLFAMALGGVALTAATAADAAAVFVDNHSFEQQVLPDGGFVNGYAPTGWSAGYAEPSGPFNPTASDVNAPVPDGENVMYSATGYDGSPYYSGNVYQQVADTVAANTRYTLTVDVGRSAITSLADFAVELTGARDPAFAAYAWGTFTSDELAAGMFRTLTITFDSIDGLATPLGIRLRTTHNPDQGTEQRIVYFDNVRLDASPILTSAVPEPATWAMMIAGFGLAGAALRRRAPAAPHAA